MKLVGARFCAFRRAAEVILRETGRKYVLFEDNVKLDYPSLEGDGLRLNGIISILEGLPLNSGNVDDSRMWLFVVLNELWYDCARDIIKNRLIARQDHIAPDSHKIRMAQNKLANFLNDLNSWLRDRSYLAINFCHADILCGAIFSYLDYLNEINWPSFIQIKDWYCAVKSRPSFAFVLDDVIPGVRPPATYRMLDF